MRGRGNGKRKDILKWLFEHPEEWEKILKDKKRKKYNPSRRCNKEEI